MVPSNLEPGAGGDHIPMKSAGQGMPNKEEDVHAPPQKREKHDNRPTVAAPDPRVMRMHRTCAHQRIWHHRGMPRLQEADQCHTTTNAGRGQGREWSKKKRVVKDLRKTSRAAFGEGCHEEHGWRSRTQSCR